MQVTKRNGNKESVSFDKITKRISDLCFDLEYVDPIVVAKDTINSLYDGITTRELDILSADICATKAHHFPDYNKLGGRILSSNIAKETSLEYKDVVEKLNNQGLLSESFYNFTIENIDVINSFFDYNRDLLFDYFAIKTLERSYLIRIDNKIVERPQHMWMRVAIQIHGCHYYDYFKNSNDDSKESVTLEDSLEKVKETYDLLSNLYFTHATPTLFNSGTKRPQLSSCFLFSSEDDIDSIFKTISDTAKISKWAGGIGLSLSNIRAKGSLIRGTNGRSEGIIPLCKTLEMVGRYINQGGKRQGSIAIYMEPWHSDIFSFVELRKNTGDENLRARDLFLALWVPDLFMKRVENDDVWSLMCPDECPGLVDSYGEKFEQLYISYENEMKYKKQVKARELWNHIIENQIETGMPYISFKDNVNRRNMQEHLGVIRNSNLCNEIALFSNKENYAVCNLASICLPKYVEEVDGSLVFNFEKLRDVASTITYNLNNVIDVNFYPTPETRKTNMENRPIGIGVQGLADVYCMLSLPFGSEKARELNKLIFENIYYGSVRMSIQLAKKYGKYKNYDGSPHSKGQLQFTMWDCKTTLDWKPLFEEMKIYGIRNSLLTALMPTASTSQIMCNNEAFEPFTSNIYLRKTLAGEFTVVNRHLIKDLLKLGLWTKEIYEEILYDNGSVQRCVKIPKNIKDIYKTAYELMMTDILKQAVERSPFVDHMQSMNLFMETVSFKKLNSSHFYAWKHGLKTGMYYLRTQAAVDPTKFGLDATSIQRIKADRKEYVDKVVKETGVCPRDQKMRELCDSCSS
jgi:ribonucleoside-diphosphate reductase alpha chain